MPKILPDRRVLPFEIQRDVSRRWRLRRCSGRRRRGRWSLLGGHGRGAQNCGGNEETLFHTPSFVIEGRYGSTSTGAEE